MSQRTRNITLSEEKEEKHVTKGLLHPLYLLAGYSVLGWNHPGFAGSSVSLFIYYLCFKYCCPVSDWL